MATEHVALPSWRGRGENVQYIADCVIISDTKAGRNSYFSVYTYGHLIASRPTLALAKEEVEMVYGPQQWKRVAVPQTPYHDDTHGWTKEFNEPRTIHVVQTLPRLGTFAVIARSLTASVYKVRVEFGKRRADAVVPASGPLTPAYLQHPSQERFYLVEAANDNEAKHIAYQMAMGSEGSTPWRVAPAKQHPGSPFADSTRQPNPVAMRDDMVTLVEIVEIVKL